MELRLLNKVYRFEFYFEVCFYIVVIFMIIGLYIISKIVIEIELLMFFLVNVDVINVVERFFDCC